MEKVIRICEITGRMTTVAENLDTETAKEMVRKLSKNDEFAQYRRVVPRWDDETNEDFPDEN